MCAAGPGWRRWRPAITTTRLTAGILVAIFVLFAFVLAGIGDWLLLAYGVLVLVTAAVLRSAGVRWDVSLAAWGNRNRVVRVGDTTTAFLTEYPPLSPPPSRAADRPWRGAFRLNLPPPSPRPALNVDAA